MAPAAETLQHTPAPMVVQVEQRGHVPPDERGSRARAPLAFVVADDRGNRLEVPGEVPLGDPEVLPPLAERAPRVGGEDDLTGDLLLELGLHGEAGRWRGV